MAHICSSRSISIGWHSLPALQSSTCFGLGFRLAWGWGRGEKRRGRRGRGWVEGELSSAAQKVATLVWGSGCGWLCRLEPQVGRGGGREGGSGRGRQHPSRPGNYLHSPGSPRVTAWTKAQWGCQLVLVACAFRSLLPDQRHIGTSLCRASANRLPAGSAPLRLHRH